MHPPMHLRRLFGLATFASALALGAACGGKTDDATTADAGDGCKPGDKKNLECNACTCDASGFWACTTMGCLDASPDAACTPGATKKLDCNTCSCMPNGEWACTGIACVDSALPDTGTDASRDPRCPSSWTAATTGSHDDLCPTIACTYPEGSCTCPGYCGGPPPGPDWKPTWTCTPKPPPRTDGCPDAELTDGASCSTAGKVCSYGSCCMYQYECISSHWKKSGPICPP